MSDNQNLPTAQDSSCSTHESSSALDMGRVHIRLLPDGSLTIVEGLPEKCDLRHMVRKCRKELMSSITVKDHPALGQIIQLTGDQRESMSQWLIKTGICQPEQVVVH